MVSHLNGAVRVTKEQVVGEFRCAAIREAAMRVVGRRGLAAATVQEIADEAGVAKGTVYLYFRSREEIFTRTTQAAVDDLLERLQGAVDEGGAFRVVLTRFLETQLAYFEEHKDFFRLYFATGEGSEEQRKSRLASRARHVAQITAMLEKAAKRGEVKVADAGRAALAIAGAAREVILRRIDEKPTRPLEEDVDLLQDLVCRGIAVPNGRSR